MSNKLIYTDHANSDLRNIALYIAQDNPDRAITFVKELKRQIELLQDNPLMGGYPRKYTVTDKNIRAYIMGNYVALYKPILEKQEIEIRRIVNVALLHGVLSV